MITASRYHDISCGHTVYGHESKCANLHGHNYRVTFNVRGELDSVGRVLDFSVIKSALCMWLEENWDHRFLVWDSDPRCAALKAIDPQIVVVEFNPTAENMARWLVQEVGPMALSGTGTELLSCTVEETRKCSATYA